MAADQSDLNGRLAAPRTTGGLSLRHAAWFFLVIPLVVGVNQGWMQAGLARYLPLPQSIMVWCGNWLAYWWVCELCTRIMAPVLRPWRTLPVVVLLAGSLLATLLSPLYMGLYAQLFTHYLLSGAPVGAEYQDFPSILGSARLFGLIASGAGGTLLWILANLFFDRYLEQPRLRALGIVRRGTTLTRTAAHDPANRTRPAFLGRLARLSVSNTDSLLAIEAQEHYIKVHAEQGSEMIYYRFGDALRDLQQLPGMQVHRSFWVARAAVLRFEQAERHAQLVLRNQEIVPVGPTFLALVRQAGFPQ